MRINFKKLDPRRFDLRGKILLVVVILALVAGGFYAVRVRSEARVTRVLANMPEASVTVINEAGESLTLPVRLAATSEARTTAFKGSGTQAIEDNVLLLRYDINTIAGHTMERVRAPLDIAFFTQEGTLVDVLQAEPGSGVRYSTTDRQRYRYVLMAREGFMEEHGINPGSDARLLPDSII